MGVALEKTGVELSLDLRFAASCISTHQLLKHETIAPEMAMQQKIILYSSAMLS